MKRNSTVVAGVLAASAVFFGIAYAQGPGCDGDGKPGFKRSSMQREGMMDPAARIEQRLSRFKTELKLTTQQEPLWQAFAEQSKAQMGKGMAMRESMKEDQAMTAPDRMARMQGMMKSRVAAMEAVNESFNRLYAALTPEQKSTADKHFSMAARHEHGPGRDGPRRGGREAPGADEPRKG
jgi:hypothetical protein